MTEEAFSEEDTAHDLLDRFEARRVMIETMVRMGVETKRVHYETPRGAIRFPNIFEHNNDSDQQKK